MSVLVSYVCRTSDIKSNVISMPIYNKFLTNILNSFLGVFLSLMTSIVIIRLISVEERGELQLYFTLSQVCYIFGSLGVPFAISLYESRKANFIDSALLTLLPVTLPLILVIPLVWYFSVKLSWMLVLFVLTNSLFMFVIDRTKNNIHIKLYSWAFLAQPLVMLILLFFINGITINQVVLFYTFTYIVSSLIWFLRPRKPTSFKVKYSSIKKLSIKIWISNIFSFTTNNADKLLILKVLSFFETGVYMALFSIASLMSKFSERLSANLLAYFQNSTSNSNSKSIRYIFAVLFLLGSPVIYVCFYMFGDYVVNLAYGEKYSGYNELLAILALSTFISSISWILAQKLIAEQKILYNLIRTIGASIVFVLVVSTFDNITLFTVAISYLISCVYRFISTYFMVVYIEKIKRKS